MAIKFEKFVGKAPVIEAVFLEEDNIDELAVWLGADGYILEKILEGNKQQVTFTKSTRCVDGKFVQFDEPRRIVRAVVGQWLVRYPRHVSDLVNEREDYYYSLSQEEIDKFVSQQLENGEVDISQPRRHY